MYHVMGCDHAVVMAAQAGQLELNVMMPVLAHNLFEMMQVTIGAVRAFTQRAVVGLRANAEKATAWLERNAILATALNPLIGYESAAELVKQAGSEGRTLRQIALERVAAGALNRKDPPHVAVTAQDIEAALGDVWGLTEGGIHGTSGGG
jgi:fumarate hydratase class II